MDAPLSNIEFYNQTTLHPLSMIVLAVLAGAMFLVPRRYALIPMLILACSVGPAQRVVIATLDFNFLRILVTVGFARVLLFGETAGFRWKLIDTILVAWVLASTVIGTVLKSTGAGAIHELGVLFDAAGIYFLIRFLVRDWDDIKALALGAAVLSVPVMLIFTIELLSGRNMFAIFGGVPDITVVRAGRLRCQGPFAHPILAGCFWASLLPLIAALWWDRGWSRPLAVLGVISALAIILMTSSATPMGGAFLALLAALAYTVRKWMSWIRWAMVGGLVLLQLVMTNPIWHLLARIDIVTGSTGWYRFKVIDAFVRNFSDWWLIGTESYYGWWEWGFHDITNQYVAQGIGGGLLVLVLFIVLIVIAFKSISRAQRREDHTQRVIVQTRGDDAATASGRPVLREQKSWRTAISWALGVSLFVHCVVFFGVSYTGQAIMVWYLTLGLIGSVTPSGSPLRMLYRAREKNNAIPSSHLLTNA